MRLGIASVREEEIEDRKTADSIEGNGTRFEPVESGHYTRARRQERADGFSVKCWN
jgi:hypothetical protein